ncbi:MAG: thermonuclease family protein [Bdellovibrionales bacterium]|nr:thermonuclease family protein [Bdellovibrionales bacterium]
MQLNGAKKFIFIIPFMFFTIQSHAFLCRNTDSDFSCVEYVKNFDGDTLTLNIKDVHPLLGNEIGVRIAGIDAAEQHSKDPCEIEMARRAQREVETIMSSARTVDLANARRGKYFRIVADVIVDGKSLGEHLLRKRLVVPYDGGTKDDIDWCKLR